MEKHRKLVKQDKRTTLLDNYYRENHYGKNPPKNKFLAICQYCGEKSCCWCNTMFWFGKDGISCKECNEKEDYRKELLKVKNYEKIARKAKIKVLELIFKAQVSHIGSNLSAIDLMSVLFEKIDLDKDIFVLSKGWAAASLYYFLWKKGKITEEELNSFCQEIICSKCNGNAFKPTCNISEHNQSCDYIKEKNYGINDAEFGHGILLCQECSGKGKVQSKFIGLAEPILPEIKIAGGSMNLGIAGAVGLALGKKLKKGKGKVYCLCSDGEMSGGMTWEAAAIASHHKLDNLVVIVDYNKFVAMGKTNEVLNIEPLKSKWENFGWNVIQGNGHNYDLIEKVLSLSDNSNFPFVFIAETIKGKGVSFMENNNLWHYAQIKKDDYEKALAKLHTKN